MAKCMSCAYYNGGCCLHKAEDNTDEVFAAEKECEAYLDNSGNFAEYQHARLQAERLALSEKLLRAEKELASGLEKLEKECSDLKKLPAEAADYRAFSLSAKTLLNDISDKAAEMEGIKSRLKLRGGALFNLSSDAK